MTGVLIVRSVYTSSYGRCIMARVCHTNNCPVGVASQREELRARFPGAPGDLVNYFHFIAEEVLAGPRCLPVRRAGRSA